MSFLEPYRRGAVGLVLACAALMVLVAPVQAATYPAGGGAFAVDAEGWLATDASCSIPLAGVCSASGAHDAANGNPPGALKAQTDVSLNLGGLFSSSVTFESPDFLVAEAGAAVMHLDRQFSAAGLLALAPQADYTVSLIDRGTETPTEVIAEPLGEADSSFAGKDGAASVVAGRTYAIAIDADTGSTAAGLGVLGESAVRFDNVALTVQEAPLGGEGGSGQPGPVGPAGGSGDATPASSSRKHVFVKVRCPRRPRRACWITAHGRIGKKVRVTYRRTVRVARGRSRTIALRIKPRFQQRVLGRKRIVVVQRVRIGERTMTFSRSRALIQRDG